MSNRSKILLLLQFACFGYFLLFQDLIASGLLLGLQILGFVICGWAIVVMGIGNFNAQPEVKVGARLIRRGPYSLIRNPMYTGLLLMFSAGLLANFNWPGLLVLACLALTFVLKIFDEETYLGERFGTAYQDYKRSTYRLIPYVF